MLIRGHNLLELISNCYELRGVMAKRENYNELYLFMQVVREGSFTAAAQRRAGAIRGEPLGARAGGALGVRFSFAPRVSLSVTHAGERLYQTAESAFDALDSGLATSHIIVRHRPARCALTPVSAIDKCLLPKLAIFKQRYPDIRLELINESRFVDIITERFDAGVRLGAEVSQGMIAVRITPDMEMA